MFFFSLVIIPFLLSWVLSPLIGFLQTNITYRYKAFSISSFSMSGCFFSPRLSFYLLGRELIMAILHFQITYHPPTKSKCFLTHFTQEVGVTTLELDEKQFSPEVVHLVSSFKSIFSPRPSNKVFCFMKQLFLLTEIYLKTWL